jgi:DNA primase large subunit
VHISSYLKAPSRIKSEKWRLINKKLEKGFVEIEQDDFIRLIEEFLRERLVEKIQIDDEIKKLIEPSLKVIEPVVFEEKKKAGQLKFDKTDTSCFPPCMKKILEDLKSGVNIPHTARFAVTSFLLNAGLDVEEVITLFRSAPDFNEERTRYQVEHIAGAKGTEYDCPACDTMRTYHNCVKNCDTYHPLSLYENCMRNRSHTVKSYKPAE